MIYEGYNITLNKINKHFPAISSLAFSLISHIVVIYFFLSSFFPRFLSPSSDCPSLAITLGTPRVVVYSLYFNKITLCCISGQFRDSSLKQTFRFIECLMKIGAQRLQLIDCRDRESNSSMEEFMFGTLFEIICYFLECCDACSAKETIQFLILTKFLIEICRVCVYWLYLCRIFSRFDDKHSLISENKIKYHQEEPI